LAAEPGFYDAPFVVVDAVSAQAINILLVKLAEYTHCELGEEGFTVLRVDLPLISRDPVTLP